MRKISILFITLFVVAIPVFAANEEMKVTTYYPSPEGEYKNLKADKLTTTNDTILALDPNDKSIVAVGTDKALQSTPTGHPLRMNVKGYVGAWDYWIFQQGRWASQPPPISLGSSNCYFQRAHRWSPVSCRAGYYLKALIKSTDGNWDGYGPVCCAADPNSSGMSYNALVADCVANPGKYASDRVTCPDYE